jgi:flagellar FliJ protein
MDALQPLLALLAQAERERDLAWAETQRALQTHQNAVVQAEQLVTYRREYEQRWSAQFQSEGRMELVHCYRGFMERLSQAVDQQQHIAEQAGLHADRARATLAEHEMRAAGVRRLIEKRRYEMRLAAERSEQKQTDDFNARMAWGQPTTVLGTSLSRAA